VSLLVLPERRILQPQRPTPHVLPPGSLVWQFGEGAVREARTSEVGIITGDAEIVPAFGGRAIRHNTVASRTQLLATDAQVPTGPCTLLLVHRKTDAVVRWGGVASVGAAATSARCNVAIPFGDGWVYWWRNGTLALGGQPIHPSAWAFTAGARGMEMWRDGRRIASNAITADRVPLGWAPYELNRLEGSANSGDLTEIPLFVLVPAQMPEAWIERHTRSLDAPWQIFERKREVVFRAAAVVVPTLTPADLALGQTLDALALAVGVTLAPADSTHAQVLDALALTQTHVLAPADLAHGQVLDAVSLTQTHALVPADLAHGQALDALTLAVGVTLAPADLAHGQVLDAVSLTQTHALAPSDSTHAQTLDAVTLSVPGAASAGVLIVPRAHAEPPAQPTRVALPARSWIWVPRAGGVREERTGLDARFTGQAGLVHRGRDYAVRHADPTAHTELWPDDSILPTRGITLLIDFAKTGGPPINAAVIGQAAHDGQASEVSVVLIASINALSWCYGSALDVANPDLSRAVWAFTHGVRGLEIWRDGVRLAHTPGNATRSRFATPLFLNRGATVTTGDHTEVGLVAIIEQQMPEAWIEQHTRGLDAPWQIFERKREVVFRAAAVVVPTLAPADLAHGQVLDALALTQLQSLAPASSTHAQALDAVSLTQTHALAPADLAHGQTLDALTLAVGVTLTPADLAHGQTLDALALTQTHVLTPADNTHAQALDAVSLTQTHALAPADLAHGQTLDGLALTLPGPPGARIDHVEFTLSQRSIEFTLSQRSIEFTLSQRGGKS